VLPGGSTRRWSGNPLPAQLAGFPAGDGLVLADYLDLPQVQAMPVHCLLSLDHSADGRGLRDLVLGTGLLHEYEMGRAGIRGRVASIAHNRLRPPGGSRCSLTRYDMRHTGAVLHPASVLARRACLPLPGGWEQMTIYVGYGGGGAEVSAFARFPRAQAAHTSELRSIT
jgi:hypothetical protein